MPVRFQVDPDFYDHPKVLSMSDAAFALWTRAGSYCAAKQTDGFVADDVLSLFSPTQQAAAPELVQRRLWRRVRGGFQFHQYEERNLTKARLDADREYERDRKQRQRKQRRAAVENASNDDREAIEDPPRHCRETDEDWSTIGRATSEPQVGNGFVPAGHPPDNRRDSGRSPNRSVSVSVSESVSGSGHAPAAADNSPPQSQEPPPRCPEHLDNPSPPPCGACAEARKARNRWEIADVERRRTQPQCRRHRGQPAHNCAMCRSEQLGAR